MIDNILTIQVQDDVDDRAARILGALVEIGKLPKFMDAVVEKRDLWTTICWLEEDMLAFSRRNRWCGCLDGWQLVVGTSPYLLEDLPTYTGYGAVQAWLLYDRQWVLTIAPAETRQLEDTVDVLVWDTEDFSDQFGAIALATVDFADDSGIHLNRSLREIRDLDAMLEVEV